jgi:hypothetical protein
MNVECIFICGFLLMLLYLLPLSGLRHLIDYSATLGVRMSKLQNLCAEYLQ